MNNEPILDQIARLRDAFNAAATGDYAHPSQEELLDDVSDLPPETKLLASNRVISSLLSHSIDLSQKQIKQNLDFLKLTTFFGRLVLNDTNFWTMETSRDLEHAQFLFSLIDSHMQVVEQIQSALGKENSPEKSGPVSQARQTRDALLADFNWRSQRYASGNPSYSKEERLVLPKDLPKETCFQDLRQKQMENTLAHVERLRDIAVAYLKRMHLTTQDLLPSEPDDPEWEKACQASVDAAYRNGLNFLQHAETFLTHCAARYSSFPQHLAQAQRAAAPPRPH